VLKLVRAYLESGVMMNGVVMDTGRHAARRAVNHYIKRRFVIWIGNPSYMRWSRMYCLQKYYYPDDDGPGKTNWVCFISVKNVPKVN
jgi:hypothetical protein